MIRALVVLYDEHCPICRRAGDWLARQPQLVPIGFIPAGSAQARSRFPGLDHDATLRDITVVADTGAVYTHDAAWLMCLWALDSYRDLSIRMSRSGAGRWTARQVVEFAAAARNYTRTDTSPDDGYRDHCDADACRPAAPAW